MIQALPLSVKMETQKRMALGLYLAYAILVLVALHAYVKWQSVNIVLGLLALPLVTVIKQQNYKNIRYGTLAACVALLTILLPVKTLLYFSVAFACLFVTDNFLGKVNLLPAGVLCLMSPVCQFMTNVFSVPIRFKLTSMAGAIMNWMLGGITVRGNVIINNGNEFSVDPACMGLNMMVTSLLLQLIIIAMYQRKHTRYLVWWQVAGLLSISFALNIVSNLFRIICLVWFNIMPGTTMHELAGIVCLLVYVIIPMVWITQLVIKYKGKEVPVAQGNNTPVSWSNVLRIHLILFIIIAGAAYKVVLKDRLEATPSAAIATVEGYKTERITTDIIKLQNHQSLIYVKNIRGFFSADHHPMICWKGSGYLFNQMQLETIGGQQIYTAVLQNGREQLYTSWWYDNGMERTVEQVNWRRKMLVGGKPFSVVNVTAENKQQLISEIAGIMQSNRLKPLL